MAKEYIEKSKLISDIECIDICDCTDIDDIFIEVERTIDEQPTADVQEVRHGKNITKTRPTDEFICSECGYMNEDITEKVYNEDGDYYFLREYQNKYCPNCGAKIDKE